MRSVTLAVLLCLLFLFLLQAGCEERGVGPQLTYWYVVTALVSQYPSLFRLGFFDTEPDTQFFYREITSSHANIEHGLFRPGDPERITLTWGDSLTGKLHYDSSGRSHQKPIVFNTRTEAYFERSGYTDVPYMGWYLRRVGGTVMSSCDGSREIKKLHIISEGVDTLLDESGVTRLVHKDSIVAFGPGKLVTFIVEAADTTDFLFLHVREGDAYQKIPFIREGEGTFSAGWTTTDDPGPGGRYYHAIVDLVSRESLAADSTEYEFTAWGIVYRIK